VLSDSVSDRQNISAKRSEGIAAVSKGHGQDECSIAESVTHGGALKRSIEDSDYPAKRSRRVNPDEIDYEKEKVCEVMRVADRYHAIVSKCFVAGKFTLNH
jgi:hypothetical protein